MCDNWPLGTRQVSFSDICCLEGGRRGWQSRKTDIQTTGKSRQGERKRRVFEWRTEMDVKMGFWEIMNLHILIEKCMVWFLTPQKGKELKSSSFLNVFHPCVFVTNLGWCNVDPWRFCVLMITLLFGCYPCSELFGWFRTKCHFSF